MTYRPELDGLRAIAVGGVLIAHSQVGLGENPGLAGVTAFFVLSGYLITSLLIAERAATGTVDLRAFYERRVRRLAPALIALLTFVVTLGLAGVWTRPWLPGVAGAASYGANWMRIVVGVDSLGPLGHTWSLAVEEQFYLLWPILFIRWPRLAVRVAIAWIPVALLLRAGTSGVFEAMSTLTRGDAILAGCLLAISGRRFSVLAGRIGLVGLAIAALPMSFDAMIALATVSTVLIVGSRDILLAPLAAIGKRAYGLYLWDYTLTNLLPVPLAELATVVMAELSWRTVEARFSRRRSAPDHEGRERPRERGEFDRRDVGPVVVSVVEHVRGA